MDQVKQTAKRIVRNVAGFLLVIVGLAMIVLPGPGWVTIGLGLALLAPDFPWAKDALDRLKYVWDEVVTRSRAWWNGRRGRA